MLGVKKLKKGDLLWQTNCQNDGAEVNFQPAIFVRNVRGDNVLIDIVQSSGDLKRESAPLKNLAISTLETMSEIDFKSKELKKASSEAYEIIKKNQADKTSCRVSLDKNDVANFKGFKSAVVRLEKIAVPNEISELEKSEEKETTQIRRRGRPRKSAASEPLVEEKPLENPKENLQKTHKEKPQKQSVEKTEEVDENKLVLKTENDIRKDFLSSLDSNDEKEKNEEENNNKENENAENKENSGPGKKKSSNQWKPVLGSGGPRKPLSQMILERETKEEKEELPDYEKNRIKNIQEQKAMFLEQLKKSAKALSTSMKPKPKPFCTPNGSDMATFRRRKIVRKIYSTRSSRQNSESPNGTPKKFEYLDENGLAALEEDYSSDEELVELAPKKRRSVPSKWAYNPNDEVLTPDQVTPEMLDNVADYVSFKVYAQSGTTCHQCRQKTTDQKTVCRSGNCAGARGMFCGVCLRNRYGQDARKALKDPDWWCPPCMDVCNCSICRNRIGKGATGIMTQLAQGQGFASVHHYLESLMKKHNK